MQVIAITCEGSNLLGARTVTTIPLQFLALNFAEAIPTSAEVYYENCDAVRAAGVAPRKRGEPGYRAGLDRDRDGWACE
ncbi:excalibur calcium-binding domain-containing protein [Lawsonella clevelandensis]|uniref:excalibur calcium-binding domain-containing protein n=1 Tax=Lawsonella clevelandensis TaxID=1528099 RepID=UPI0028F4482E|nr:excalibur calcium-binding domain-containing protein [Lawsonella clevelandensis]